MTIKEEMKGSKIKNANPVFFVSIFLKNVNYSAQFIAGNIITIGY